MSHVDEGRLHAYLDGEEWRAVEREALERHLAECAECRARLEEERRVRERASAILDRSGPAGVRPVPFEELVARSGARARRRQVFAINRLTAVGWAATIVVAVGVGWMARGAIGIRERSLEDRMTTVSREADAPQQSAAAERHEATPAEATPSRPAQAPIGTQPEQASRGFVANETPGAPAPLPAAQLAESDARRRAETEVAGVQAPAAKTAAAPAAGALAAQARPVEERARGEEQVVAAVQAPADEAVAAEAAGLGVLLRDAIWTPSGRTEAERRLGSRLLAVEGLPILGIELAESGGNPASRTLQALGGSAVVEIIQWRVRDAAQSAEQLRTSREAAAAPAEPARATLAMTRDGFVVVISAPVGRDSLRVLLSRIP